MTNPDTVQSDYPESKLDRENTALRDLFAAHALAGMGTWTPVGPYGNGDILTDNGRHDRAVWAYAQAECMLTMRKHVLIKEAKARARKKALIAKLSTLKGAY